MSENLNFFLLDSESVSSKLVWTYSMAAKNVSEEKKKDRAPPSFDPISGPIVAPRPKYMPYPAVQTPNFCGSCEKRSANAACAGAAKPKIIEPEIMRSMNCMGNDIGFSTTRLCRKAFTAGAIIRKNFRPCSSLSLPRIGLTTNSMIAAKVDINPIARAVKAASPFLIWSTIGARVGTTIVTAVIMKAAAMHSFRARSSSLGSSAAFVAPLSWSRAACIAASDF
mmetsp:Transcript_82762/g.208348  ORF Transcript_82762/g.208348 Transcript_82762/m.208348 type:complete len:224 (-) Transcript_82762:80-751(-)